MKQRGTKTRQIKQIVELAGGQLLKINWKNRTMHLLTPTNNKIVELIPYEAYS